GLMPAERPRLRSGLTLIPLCSIIALAISALPAPKAAMSACTICSILARDQGVSGAGRIVCFMKLFLFRGKEQIKNFYERPSGTGALAGFPLSGMGMLTVLIETKDHEEALARTLASLVGAAVEGIVRDVLVCDLGSVD